MKEYIVSEDSYEYEMRRYGELKELIRCKDCIYYIQGIDMCAEPYSMAHNVVHEDDYCSMAERKE